MQLIERSMPSALISTRRFDASRENFDRQFEATHHKIDTLRSDFNAKFDASRKITDRQFEATHHKIEVSHSDLDSKIAALDGKVESKFNTLIVVMATGGVAILGSILALAFAG